MDRKLRDLDIDLYVRAYPKFPEELQEPEFRGMMIAPLELEPYSQIYYTIVKLFRKNTEKSLDEAYDILLNVPPNARNMIASTFVSNICKIYKLGIEHPAEKSKNGNIYGSNPYMFSWNLV